MFYKWIGAVFVIAGCGSVGLSIAFHHRKEKRTLHQLLLVLQFMECELQYRLTSLPELCKQASRECRGSLSFVFANLSRELDWQIAPDACSCMTAALKKSGDIPISVRKLLLQLGHTLGRFDLSGQITGIKAVSNGCEKELKRLEKDQDNRIRSYQTLSLCAGIALVILFI